MTRTNPLLALREFGQSVWLDDLDRPLLDSGELARLIEMDGLRGLTSNPSTFAKAIIGSRHYERAIGDLARSGLDVREIYERLVVADVRDAADLLRPTYDESDGRHGFVSLEVDPHLARDADATVAEARRLWRAVDRPNLFVKVPGTREGLDAIARLLAEGVNVNVTLLFGIARYREVAEAYLAGLEGRVARGGDPRRVASVASFFLSRIDVLVDDELARVAGRHAEAARALRGRVAVASAKLARAVYREIFTGDRFARLAARGARTQPLLWASTGTKNPAYSDVMYVEPLVGPDTISTMPRATLDAYRDQGRPGPTLDAGLENAREALRDLADAGIDLDDVASRLVEEGIAKFVRPFDELQASLREARDGALAAPDRRARRQEEA